MMIFIKIAQSPRYHLYFVSFVFLFLLGGCASHPILFVKHNKNDSFPYQAECVSEKINKHDIADALKKHIIDVDKQGQFSSIKFAINCPPDPLLEGEQEDEIGKLVEKIVSNLKTENSQELLIYIHGGLVTRQAGIESAVELTQAILGENNNIYPVSFVWRSGGWESYRDQLFNVRNGIVNKRLAIATSPFKLGSDLGRGIMDTPYAGGLEAHRLFLSLQNKLNYCAEMNDGDKEIVICPEPHDFSALDKVGDVLGTARYFLMTPVRVGTAPFINGLGRSGYENMVRRTREAFLRDTNLTSEIDSHKGAVYLFFEALQDRIDAKPNVTITLIGHSMGTMLVNEIIRQFPDLPYKHVVFMGAAVSIRDFQNVVVPHLSNQQTFKFYNLSLLPVAETREMNDFLNAIPSGSLLEWIDDMLSSPPTLADRTLGKWVNIRDVMPSFSEESRKNMTMRVFGTRKGQPQAHGQFNDIKRCFWRESFWTAKDGPEWDEHFKKCSDYLEKIW
jgi:pimeloyl-ACP methyl ester carboxylesterase